MPDARLKRSNTGCMTCRRRKKKCDEIHPVCTGCKKNYISCSWGTVPRKSQRHREHGYNKDFAVPPELGAMVTIFAAPCPSLTRRLISHFIEYSPSWLSPIGGPKRNNFLHHVLSAAMENQLIFDCLLSVAARDLCKMGNDHVELERLSYEYYCVAATNLSTAITDEIESIKSGEGHYSADDTLLAVLLLCVHEAVNFSCSDRLLLHINGAATLIAHRLHCVPNNADMRGFLFEVFLYFFTLAASTHGSRMQLDSTLAYEIFRSPLLKGHQSQGMLLGTSQELFFIILRLSALMHGTTSPLLDSATIRSELLLIDLELLQFLMNLMDSSLPNNGNSEPVLCSKLYGLACRLIVKKTLQPTLPDNDDSIQEIVSAFSTSLELLSPTSLAHGVLCWPVVIIGLSAINGKHRSLVTARLKTIQEVWRSDIPLQSAKYLAQKWKEDKNRSFEGASTTILGSVYRQDILELPVILV